MDDAKEEAVRRFLLGDPDAEDRCPECSSPDLEVDRATDSLGNEQVARARCNNCRFHLETYFALQLEPRRPSSQSSEQSEQPEW